jgi:CheY-like chemotaxis protein
VKTILVVDDEPAHAEALSLILEQEGYRVYCASTRQALERATAVRPQLVILDVRPPVMAGASTARVLRSAATLAPLAILAMSTMGEAEVQQRFDGYDAFVRKPFSVEAALATVRKLLS